jgi:putative methionine-R-sulfoxide reductase with GAF domain
MIQPVVNSSGDVVGTLDIEADRVTAFTSYDESYMRACATVLQWLWLPERTSSQA